MIFLASINILFLNQVEAAIIPKPTPAMVRLIYVILMVFLDSLIG